jgi:hypothetical protein
MKLPVQPLAYNRDLEQQRSGIIEREVGRIALATTPSGIGATLYPQTTAEAAANVSPADYSYPPGDLRRYGATGGDDDTSAFAAWALVGGRLSMPSGTYITRAPIVFDVKGTVVTGAGAQWGTEIAGASVIKAHASFSGAAIVEFSATSTSRAAGLNDLTVDGGDSSVAHGIAVVRGYDNAKFDNVSVQNIDGSKNAWRFTNTDAPQDSAKSQTIVCTNIMGRHRSSSASAPTFYARYLQECVFINPKMWAGADSSAQAAADCYHIKSCNGVTFINPAAAFSSAAAFRVEADSTYCKSVTIDTPTIENCSKPLVTLTTCQLLFGSVSPVPSIGETLSQSGVTGTIILATASGIYVNNVSGGSFAPGVACTVGGVATITPGTVYAGRVSALEFRSPRLTGLTSYAAGQEYSIDDTVDSRIDFGEGVSYASTTNEPTAVYALKVGQSPLDADASNAGARGIEIVYSSYPYSVAVSGKEVRIIRKGYPVVQTGAQIGGSAYTLPKAKVGQEITIINDDAATYKQLAPNTGDQFRLNGATANWLRLWRLGSVVTLSCEAATYWDVKSYFGVLEGQAIGFVHSGRNVVESNTSTSVAIGGAKTGTIQTNTGAASTVTFNLSSAVAGTRYTFVRNNATYALRIDPSGSETIRGGGAGKYLSLNSDGASVTLACVEAGKWEILSSFGTTAFEP